MKHQNLRLWHMASKLLILSTNRRLNIEASNYLHGTYLFIRVRSNTNGLEQSFAELGSHKSQDFNVPPNSYTNRFHLARTAGASNHEFIIAHQDLRLFLLLLWKANLREGDFLKGCHVNFEILNNFGLSDQCVQQRLLIPWEQVVDFQSVSITGNVPTHYAAELAAIMMATKPSLETLACCTHTFEEMGCVLNTEKSSYTGQCNRRSGKGETPPIVLSSYRTEL